MPAGGPGAKVPVFRCVCVCEGAGLEGPHDGTPPGHPPQGSFHPLGTSRGGGGGGPAPPTRPPWTPPPTPPRFLEGLGQIFFRASGRSNIFSRTFHAYRFRPTIFFSASKSSVPL